tara:strand:+ start:830 stop:1510 length:681 start_codon:yes stop_codon:yes gene_type:complete
MKPFSISQLKTDSLNSAEILISGQPISAENLAFPLITGAYFDEETYTLHFLRSLEAPSIDINLSGLAGPAEEPAISLQWFEDDSGDLMIRTSSFESSEPALVFWEDDGSDSYMPLNYPTTSPSNSYQFFAEDPFGNLTPTDESITHFGPTIPTTNTSLQWFEDNAGELMIRSTSFESSNPALVLWEDDGTDSYMPLNSPFSSPTDSYQFFTEDDSGNLIPTEYSTT